MNVCGLCQKEFQNKSNFNRHIKRFHPTKDELDYYETDASDNDEDDNMGSAVEEDDSDNSDTESDNGDTEDCSKNELEVDIWMVIDQEASKYDNGDLAEAVKIYLSDVSRVSSLVSLDLSPGQMTGQEAMLQFYRTLAFPLQGVCR